MVQLANVESSPSPSSDLDELILTRLVEGAKSLTDLAASCGLRLSDLAAWATEPRVGALLRGLRRMSEACAAIAIDRHRAESANTLALIARERKQMQVKADEAAQALQEEDPRGARALRLEGARAAETARRACVDLLRARASTPALARSADRETKEGEGAKAPANAPSEQAILDMLQRLGDPALDEARYEAEAANART